MTEYPHICITDPHSTIFELFDPTRIWLFQYSHGICHWKIEIYTMYSHIYLQFDNFWAYSTRPTFDQMIFALNRTRLFRYSVIHYPDSTLSLKRWLEPAFLYWCKFNGRFQNKPDFSQTSETLRTNTNMLGIES